MKEFLSNYINALTYEDIFDNLCMSFKYSIIKFNMTLHLHLNVLVYGTITHVVRWHTFPCTPFWAIFPCKRRCAGAFSFWPPGDLDSWESLAPALVCHCTRTWLHSSAWYQRSMMWTCLVISSIELFLLRCIQRNNVLSTRFWCCSPALRNCSCFHQSFLTEVYKLQ